MMGPFLPIDFILRWLATWRKQMAAKDGQQQQGQQNWKTLWRIACAHCSRKVTLPALVQVALLLVHVSIDYRRASRQHRRIL